MKIHLRYALAREASHESIQSGCITTFKTRPIHWHAEMKQWRALMMKDMRENNKRQLPICMLCSHPEPAEISMWKTWVGCCWVYSISHTKMNYYNKDMGLFYQMAFLWNMWGSNIRGFSLFVLKTNLLTLTLETKWRKAVVFNFLHLTLFASSEKFQGDLNFALRLAVTNIKLLVL